MTKLLLAMGLSLGTIAFADDTPFGTVVFLDSGAEIAFRVDGREIWRSKFSKGEFFRSSFAGASKVIADKERLIVDSSMSLHAMDIGTGVRRWTFDFARPTNLVRVSNLLLAEDHILLSTNQIGNPLVCLDKVSGKTKWSYPEGRAETLGFYELAVRRGKVLVRVASTRRGQQGYTYENRALLLETGERTEWPQDLKKVPSPPPFRGGGRTDSVFAGATLAPRKLDDRFVGILRRSDQEGYHLYRPRFYQTGPHYRFQPHQEAEFAKLVGQKVDIRGKVLRIGESAPPQYLIQARTIRRFLED